MFLTGLCSHFSLCEKHFIRVLIRRHSVAGKFRLILKRRNSSIFANFKIICALTGYSLVFRRGGGGGLKQRRRQNQRERHLKYNSISFLLRDYFNSFNFYRNCELQRNQTGRSGFQVEKEKKKIHRRVTFSTKP